MFDQAHRHPRDGGFTLVELLVVVVILAVVATVIAAAATVILRTAGPTGVRADDSRTLHSLNTWLARDASSTAPNDFAIPGSLTECSGAVSGTSLVKMIWTENTGSAVNYVANYRHVADGTGDFRIERYTCSGTGAGPYGNTSVLRMGSELPATLPTVTPVNRGGKVVGVDMTITTREGESIFIDGDTRDPDQTLPATTTTTSTTQPTTTTTSSTTTTTTIPCVITSLSTNQPSNEVPVRVKNADPGILARDVVVSATWTGPCSNVFLRYSPTGTTVTQLFTLGSPNTVTLLGFPSGGTQTWSVDNGASTHTLTVGDDNNASLATIPLKVLKCSVNGGCT